MTKECGNCFFMTNKSACYSGLSCCYYSSDKPKWQPMTMYQRIQRMSKEDMKYFLHAFSNEEGITLKRISEWLDEPITITEAANG